MTNPHPQLGMRDFLLLLQKVAEGGDGLEIIVAVPAVSYTHLLDPLIQSAKSIIARCGMTMPLGVPVEPEVKRR